MGAPTSHVGSSLPSHLCYRLLILFVALCILPSRSSGQTLDQSEYAPSFFSGTYSFGSNFFAAQTYTAGITGSLSSVNVRICSNDAGVTVQIRDTVSGMPGGTILGSTSIPNPVCGSLNSATFSGVPQFAGTQYAIVVLDLTGGGPWAFMPAGTAYAGGGGSFSSDSGATWTPFGCCQGIFQFQTFVNPAKTVTSLADDGSPGTLRYEIANANSGDMITFSVAGTITLTQGVLELSRDVMISGPGAANLAISGNSASTVFQIDPNVIGAISGVTIENGNCNTFGCSGGAIYNDHGTLTVTNSTFSGNSAGYEGGGIFQYGGTLTVTNSTFSGNSAYGGGAILFDRGTLTVTNSTFSGNSGRYGGGIDNASGTVVVTNSTFSGNSAGYGGGIVNDSGILTVKNTLLANSSSGGNCYTDGSNTFTSAGYNLSDDTSCSSYFTQTGDINNTSGTNNNFAGLDPEGLQNNGGPTQTIALLSSSGAVDSGSCTDVNGNTIISDQRGVPRPQGNSCDIGAYESINSCVQPPSGAVAWWAAEGDVNDIVNGNNGILQNGTTFSAGEVGQAFSFDGISADVKIPASPTLNVGANSGSFTVAGWINPSDVSVPRPVVEWNSATGIYPGVHLWVGLPGPGGLFANIVDSNAADHAFYTSASVLSASVYQYVALTYDETTGVGTLYVNGTAVAQQTLGVFVPQTSFDLYFGIRPPSSVGPFTPYIGAIDEVQVFNRALTATEILTIYASSKHGVCEPPATSISLTSSVNPSTYSQSVTLTATVTSQSGSPTGTVTFKDGATTIGTGTLNGSGQTTLSTSSLTTGPHSITAVYANFPSFAASTSPPLNQSVNVAPTTTVVGSSLNQSTYGQSVTYTAVVSSNGGTPTGAVTFYDGTTSLGSGLLDGSGQATLAITTLLVGTHSITVAYGGDANFGSSTSAPLSQVVAKATTSTSLTSSPNPSTLGQSVSLNATVMGQYGGFVSGTVTFKDGNKTLLGTVTLSNGTAMLSYSGLGLGSHNITATYGGDTNDTGSTSPPVTQNVVSKTTTTTTVASSMPSGSYVGQSVTFTATINAASATGTVTFVQGQNTLGTVNVKSGQAGLATTSLPAGTLTITAKYSGDTTYAASSGSVSQVVSKGTTAISTFTISPKTVSAGQSVNFSATVSVTAPVGGAAPTGTVNFNSGSTTLAAGSLIANPDGTATVNVSTSRIAKGKYNVKAVYGGSPAYSGSSLGTITLTVQ